MKIVTDLPFSSLAFRHWSGKGEEVGIVVVKGTFEIHEGERARLVRTKPDLILSDQFHGESNASSLRQESELAPYKPKTDVTFHAMARSPEGKALDGWPVRFSIGKRAHLAFHVCGARRWEPAGLLRQGWRLSEPETMTQLPLRYEFAYGGTSRDKEGREIVHPYNPVGRGFMSAEADPAEGPIPAPQIGLLPEFAAASVSSPFTVCGVGPLAKSWLPRLTQAGTFDDAWLRERHPRMPEDYSFAFWNAAPQALQIGPYLRGDEAITVTGLRHDPRPYTFGLPGAGLACRAVSTKGERSGQMRLNLDTVHCDIADADRAAHRLTVVWRLALPEPDETDHVEIFAASPSEE